MVAPGASHLGTWESTDPGNPVLAGGQVAPVPVIFPNQAQGAPRSLVFGNRGLRVRICAGVTARSATGVEGRVEIASQWTAMRRGNQLPDHLRYREAAG